jgi:hypothetical protein
MVVNDPLVPWWDDALEDLSQDAECMPALPRLDSTLWSPVQAPRGFGVRTYEWDHFPAQKFGERSE